MALVLRRTRHHEGNFFFFFSVVMRLAGFLGRKPSPVGGAPVKLKRSPESKVEKMLDAKDTGSNSLNRKTTLSCLTQMRWEWPWTASCPALDPHLVLSGAWWAEQHQNCHQLQGFSGCERPEVPQVWQ
jgi:hypothetical protein